MAYCQKRTVARCTTNRGSFNIKYSTIVISVLLRPLHSLAVPSPYRDTAVERLPTIGWSLCSRGCDSALVGLAHVNSRSTFCVRCQTVKGVKHPSSQRLHKLACALSLGIWTCHPLNI